MKHSRTRSHEHKTETTVSTPGLPEVGWLAAGSTPGALLVDFPSNSGGPIAARTTVAIDAPTLERALRTKQGVLLQFERGQPDLPIITGLIQVAESPLVELLLSSAPRGTAAPPDVAEAQAPAAEKTTIEAKLDGKRVVIEADQEVLLRCGGASITLTRDGKVLLRGTYVETRSRGVNRIKGGSVKIN